MPRLALVASPVMASKYHSPHRAEVAAATRAAIVNSARELFLANGYGTVTVADIAAAAAVAVPTVYASAGGKAEILREILIPAVRDPSVADTLKAVADIDDPDDIIDVTAAGARLAHERHWDVLPSLLPHCRAEPSAAAVLEASNAECLAALAVVADRLVAVRALRSDLDHLRAVDLLWFHFGQEAWLTLVSDRGWTFGQAETWLAESAKHALCGPRPPAGSR